MSNLDTAILQAAKAITAAADTEEARTRKGTGLSVRALLVANAWQNASQAAWQVSTHLPWNHPVAMAADEALERASVALELLAAEQAEVNGMGHPVEQS